MSEKKFFCDECREDVGIVVKEQQMTYSLKGEEYTYSGKIAYCEECGSEIYVADINDYNLKALYDQYRERQKIVSLDTILGICEKYVIGKRPISLLLGWGEQTFSRYCDGDVPSKQYSKILQRIYDDPQYYNLILETNRDKISRVAYKKSKKAVEALLDENVHDGSSVIVESSENKMVQKNVICLVSEYLVQKCEDITPLALQKALYYVQGFYYAFYQKFLFAEDCQAWVHGPVYKEMYYRYKDYRFDPVQCEDKTEKLIFSASEKAVLDSIIKYVCCYSGKVLESFTHYEAPWLIARGTLPAKAISNKVIDKENIGKYFCSVKEKYNMVTPNDMQEYFHIMFQRL